MHEALANAGSQEKVKPHWIHCMQSYPTLGLTLGFDSEIYKNKVILSLNKLKEVVKVILPSAKAIKVQVFQGAKIYYFMAGNESRFRFLGGQGWLQFVFLTNVGSSKTPR